MKSKILVTVMAIAVITGFGCQQQSRPSKGTKVSGLERIHFDLDSSDIKSEAKRALEGNASWLKNSKSSKVTVEGHCDERGTEEYNVALGYRRANSAKNYLVSLGVDGKRLGTKSLGEERPLENCHNESCWWKNRRAEFVK